MAPVRAGHDEYRLAVDFYTAGFLPCGGIYNQHLMTADRGHEGKTVRDGPALEVRHLVYGQFLLAFAVTVQDAAHAGVKVP